MAKIGESASDSSQSLHLEFLEILLQRDDWWHLFDEMLLIFRIVQLPFMYFREMLKA